MIKVAIIARSTLHEVPGGSTVQIIETAKALTGLGVDVKIFLAHEKIDYDQFDLIHFFDLIRPANILYHIKRTSKPVVISPILVDYSEYDKAHRKGIAGFIFRIFSADQNEYLKTVARWLIRKDSLPATSYLWKGHRRVIGEILLKTSLLLPNSKSELEILQKKYKPEKRYAIIPNGIDENLFSIDENVIKDDKLVICAARIEGIKNQLNLIRALNNTKFTLMLIGEAAPNQKKYYKECKAIAASNIVFTGRISQKELASYYQKAKVHILPSWFETCGLSSLEAAAMGCNIVITDKGFTRDYFGNDAYYCHPGDVRSIYQTVEKAASSVTNPRLRELVLKSYTWKNAAALTLKAYKTI